MSIKIALAGNPNCGKTTLFNNLTGSNQYVGNWPGVTVEKKEGRLVGNKDVIIQDLPGIYSLSPYTLEEVVTRNYLVQEKPDVILNIIDGTNIERNLYLTTQLVEVGLPMVIAINMMDLVRKNGDKIDIAKLEKKLGCKVIEISALKGDAQVNMFKQELAKNPVAMGLAALSPESLYEVLDECAEKNIPVVCFDAGVPDDPSGAVVATASTDNEAAASIAAETFGECEKLVEKMKKRKCHWFCGTSSCI